jgi:tRNA nucleotidyltransferase/poly(A) polymerase
LFDNSGKQLTIKDVVDAILALGIPVYFMGGFLRDIIQNKRADDIDLRFG